MTQNLTTVFIGNISESCSNDLIQKLLKICGPINSWKRLQDTNGKYQAFGFCEFLSPDGTLHALRVLDKLQLGEKKLTVKTDDITAKLLDEFQTKKQLSKELNTAADAFESKQLLEKVISVIKEDNPQLLEVKEYLDKDGDSSRRRNTGSRASHRSSRSRSRSHHRGESKSKQRFRRQRSISSQRHVVLQSKRSRSPMDSKKRKSRRRRHSSESSGSAGGSRSSRSSSPASSRDRRRHSSGHHRKRRSNTPESAEDHEDAEERHRLKAEIKRKEHSYMKRLEKWEEREHRMTKQYERDEENENERRKMIQREAKKLRQFLEDYDDERDDPKYYNNENAWNSRSSSLMQRRRNYEREREMDIRDRQEELQEIEELKRQILAEKDSVEDVEAEALRLYEEKSNSKLKSLRKHSGSPTPHRPLGQPANGTTSAQHQSGTTPSRSVTPLPENSDEKMNLDDENFHDNIAQSQDNDPDIVEEDKKETNNVENNKNDNYFATSSSSSTTVGSCAKITLQKPVLARVNGGIFGDDDDDEEQQTKRKIKPFEITREDRIQAMTPEERKKLIKELIERIPTTPEPLFAFGVAWEFVDEMLVERRIRPWINKKICEYIGEEEQSLVTFICEKIAARVEPKKILADLAMVLDDEAEVFMIKLWRLIIYESEAKKLGLTVLPSSSSISVASKSSAPIAS